MIKKQEINDDLRVQHGDVYKKFFCEHNLVFSTNNVIDWGIGIGESFNNFKIKQKVSTKTYCGVKFNQTGKVYLNKIYEYDGLENSFVVTNFEDSVVDYSLIQKFLDENYTAVGNKGIELSFICENPRGHGCGAGDVVSLLAVFAMMYTEGTITPSILKKKIILPLKKLTKKYFGKEVDLDCAGGLGGFNLTLNEKEIKIGVVKNV